jgi:hypothetical protein
MRRFSTLSWVAALLLAACNASATPSPTAAPATPTPTAAAVVATSAPSETPAPTATRLVISADVTFDGNTCTYAGPSVVPRGAIVAFGLTNTPAALKITAGATLFVMPVRDGTTWDEIVAYMKAHHHVSDVPDWARIPGLALDGLAEVSMASTSELIAGNTMKIVMTRNLYYVMCGTPENDGGFPGALLTVMGA